MNSINIELQIEKGCYPTKIKTVTERWFHNTKPSDTLDAMIFLDSLLLKARSAWKKGHLVQLSIWYRESDETDSRYWTAKTWEDGQFTDEMLYLSDQTGHNMDVCETWKKIRNEIFHNMR